MKVVSDASPMIILSRIGFFTLLHDLFLNIHVPTAIYQEVVTQGKGLPGSEEVASALNSWLFRHRAPSPKRILPEDLLENLTVNDAQVVALALHQKADLVLADDPKVRRAIEALGISVTGVAGILFRGKQSSFIETIREPLEAAIAQKLRLSDTLKEHILKKADEWIEEEG